MIFGMEPISLFLLATALILIWTMRGMIAAGILVIIGVIGVGILFIGAVATDLFNRLFKKKRKEE